MTTKPLTPERVRQAFALIQASLPEVAFDSWCRFAEAMLTRQPPAESGILTVMSEQGYIAGLSCYRVEPDLLHGQSLSAGHFVAFDLLDRGSVAAVLAEGLEALARARRCGAVHTYLLSGGPEGKSNRLIDPLTRQGHTIKSVCLCKRLT